MHHAHQTQRSSECCNWVNWLRSIWILLPRACIPPWESEWHPDQQLGWLKWCSEQEKKTWKTQTSTPESISLIKKRHQWQTNRKCARSTLHWLCKQTSMLDQVFSVLWPEKLSSTIRMRRFSLAISALNALNHSVNNSAFIQPFFWWRKPTGSSESSLRRWACNINKKRMNSE